MPRYSFRCGACGNEFDDFVPVGTDAFDCSKCGSMAAKVFAPVRFTYRQSACMIEPNSREAVKMKAYAQSREAHELVESGKGRFVSVDDLRDLVKSNREKRGAPTDGK